MNVFSVIAGLAIGVGVFLMVLSILSKVHRLILICIFLLFIGFLVRIYFLQIWCGGSGGGNGNFFSWQGTCNYGQVLIERLSKNQRPLPLPPIFGWKGK